MPLSHHSRRDVHYRTTFAAPHLLLGAFLGKYAIIKNFKAYTGCLGEIPLEALLCALPGPGFEERLVKRWDLDQSQYASNIRTFDVAIKVLIQEIFGFDSTGCLALLRDLLAKMSSLHSLKLDFRFGSNNEPEMDQSNTKFLFIKDIH